MPIFFSLDLPANRSAGPDTRNWDLSSNANPNMLTGRKTSMFVGRSGDEKFVFSNKEKHCTSLRDMPIIELRDRGQ